MCVEQNHTTHPYDGMSDEELLALIEHGLDPKRSEAIAALLRREGVETMGDRKLLALIKYGTIEEKCQAMAVIYRRYGEDIYKFARSKGVDRDTAQDILHEVWMLAWIKLHDFKWRGIAIKAWLLSTAYNKCNEHFRESKKRDQVHAQAHFDTKHPFDTVDESTDDQTKTIKRLHQFLERLKPVERKVFEMKALDGKKSREIGEILDLKASNVRQIYRRVRKKWAADESMD